MRYDQEGFVTAQDGTRIFVGALGDPSSPTVVLCDGIGCDGFVWRYLGPHLAQHHRVLHWHYRGHGRSGAPRDARRLNIVGLASDLSDVLDSYGIEKAILIGHSMGTQVCLESYRLAPSRVAAMVLMCGSSGRVTHTFHGSNLLSQVLPSIRGVAKGYRGLARAMWGMVPSAFALQVAKLTGEVDRQTIAADDFRRYWDHVAVMDPLVFLDLLDAAGEHSAADLLGRIEAPTLVIAAENDTFTPAAEAHKLADAIPTAEMFMIRNGSHAAPVEQPALVEGRIDKFLTERLHD